MIAVSPDQISGLFRCPITHQPLKFLSEEELATVSAEIADGRRLHTNGTSVDLNRLDVAFATPDRRYVYPVLKDIFCLVPTLAIVFANDVVLSDEVESKEIVKRFYDEYGWQENDAGVYNDVANHTVRNPVAEHYAQLCDDRIASWLRRGEFLMDAASGPLAHPWQLAFSRNYGHRICVDFSMQALREGQKRLATDKGIFILGDLTNLPIADGVIDDAVSLHTIYHIPADLQATAVDEIVRVLKPPGQL